MSRQYIQQLTQAEYQRLDEELESAIENHAQWLNRINRTLIGGAAFDEQEVADEPHRHCYFGRWYNNVNADALRLLPAFVRVGAHHKKLHEAARDLLLKSQEGETIPLDQYDLLIGASEQLRALINELRATFRQNLQVTARIMGQLFQHSNEGVVITDLEGTIVSVNDTFINVTGYGRNEVIGKNPNILRSGRQNETFYKSMWETLLERGYWQGEIWNRRKDGTVYLESLSIAAVTDTDGNTTNYIGIFSDISQQRETEDRIYYLAHFDSLTDLPNRLLFKDRLEQALYRAHRDQDEVAVMFLDLDGFKEVNDSQGHNVGDRLLTQVAERLRESLRESDTIARFGGDEFTIVLPEADRRTGVSAAAHKLLEAVAVPYQLDAYQAQVTASIGIALYPEDAASSDELIRLADTAMYKAKNRGRNCYCFFNDGCES